MNEAAQPVEEQLQTQVEDQVQGDNVDEVKIPDGFIPVEQNQKEVNKQHRLRKDAERQVARLKADQEKIQKEFEELKAKSVDLTVPPAPDPYSETYAEEIQARDEKIQQIADHKAKQASLEAAQQQNTIEADTEAQRKNEEAIHTFDANFLKLGLKPDEMKEAANTVIENGISETMEDIILLDPEGPLFVKYFADNPVEQDKLEGMTPFQLLDHLNSNIRPKASLLKPKTSQAPPPPDTLDGGGVGEIEDPLLKGVKFE